MVDQSLLEILVCPESRQPLRVADEELLERVNASVRSGSLKTRTGRTVSDPLEEALMRQDGQVLYPVRDGIPILLIDEAILLSA